tara:strand:- start:6635 stop:7591 length:957 start_codon:yes stop_codon:yes gene_type:complete
MKYLALTILLTIILSACSKSNYERCNDINISTNPPTTFEIKKNNRVDEKIYTSYTLEEVAEICFTRDNDSDFYTIQSSYNKGASALLKAGLPIDEIMKRVDKLWGVNSKDYNKISIRDDIQSELEISELVKAEKLNSLEKTIKYLNTNNNITRSMAQKLTFNLYYALRNESEEKNRIIARKALVQLKKNKDLNVNEFATSYLESFDQAELEKTYEVGKKLWEYYKTFEGNRDRPGYSESEYVNGNILSTCRAGNKYPGYYGWIEFKTTYLMGNFIENPETLKLYIGVIDYGDSIEGVVRGEEYVDAIKKYLKTKGCKI